MNGNSIMENSALRSVLAVQDSLAVPLVGTANSTGDKTQETDKEESIVVSVPTVPARTRNSKTCTTIFRHSKDVQSMIQILAEGKDTTISEMMREFVKKEYKIFQNRKQEPEP